MHRAFVFALCCLCGGAQAGITVQPFGRTAGGTPVERVTLENERGMRLAFIDYGATLVAAEVPDRKGVRRNVLLKLPDFAAYQRTNRRFAAVMGRYAGRIGGARFTLDGRSVELVPNAKGVALHGDPDGYDRRLWRRRDFADAASIGAVYSIVSADGDQRFPGRVEVSVTYRLLRKTNEFRIEYAASTDAPTVINLTNHAYFNLGGEGTRGIASHRFTIRAGRYAATDSKRIPTGVLASVAGTPLDFRKPAPMIAAPSALLGEPPGFDHSLVFDKPDGTFALVAVIDDTASGRRMEVRTTEPSLQLNDGGGFDGSENGYRRNDGFAFETQHLPDSPNHANFPSTALYPGKPFSSVTSYRFSVR
jgi:aldose 1-epimerase